MTNKEKFRDEIEDFIFSRQAITFIDNKLAKCVNVRCEDCQFYNNTSGCVSAKKEWLNEEYKEPTVDWSKVKVDAPVIVCDSPNGIWLRRYFAFYSDNKIHTYPYGLTSWTYDMKDYSLEYWEYGELAKLAESEE